MDIVALDVSMVSCDELSSQITPDSRIDTRGGDDKTLHPKITRFLGVHLLPYEKKVSYYLRRYMTRGFI